MDDMCTVMVGEMRKLRPWELKEGNVRLETEIVQTAGGCDVGTDNKSFVLSVMMEKWEEDAVEGRKGASPLENEEQSLKRQT